MRTPTVVRLLQNPLCQEAPPGDRGDLVRVSDGRTRVHLLANEFDRVSAATLRWMLASEPQHRPRADNHELAVGRAGAAAAG